MNKKRSKKTRINFTVVALNSVKIPAGKAAVTVYDTQTRGLACRISRTGRKTMMIYKKVCGLPTRKMLGELVAGGEHGLAWFRGEASREVGAIAKSPTDWLEGERAASTPENLTVDAAFVKTLARTKRGPLARQDWNKETTRFAKWLKENFKHIRLWGDLKKHHIDAYWDELRTAGHSANHIRLLTQPLRQTGRMMARMYNLADPALNMEVSAELKSSPPAVILADVLELLGWLKVNWPWLEAGAALIGLCGLRLTEALRIEWRDVDLDRGLVSVGARGEVKNKFSKRTIPLAARVVEALRRASDRRTVGAIETIDAKVLCSRSGSAFLIDMDHKGWGSFGSELSEAIQAWNPSVKWRGKDLRNCLPQTATMEGWAGGALELYLGHAAASLTLKHYVGQLANQTTGEKALFDKTMAQFKTLIVDRLDGAIAEIQNETAAKVVEATKGGMKSTSKVAG